MRTTQRYARLKWLAPRRSICYCPRQATSISSPTIVHTPLQVQALRLAFLLRPQNSLPSGTEVGHLDAHSALPESHETGFGANGLDVGTRQIILLGDELLEVDVLVKRHLAGVQGEDLALGVLVGVLEQNLAVNAARADQRRVEGLDLVRCHDNLDVAAVVEAVQLVEELQHRPLDFAFAARGRLIALRANSIDLVNENNRGGVLSGDLSLSA